MLKSIKPLLFLRKMNNSKILYNNYVSKSILDSLPAFSSTDTLWPKLREAVALDQKRLVVLDDDPTGCQSVYGCNILLDYSVESLKKQLNSDHKLFYILTNSRAMTEMEAIKVTKQVIKNLQEAGMELRYPYQLQIISRSDSTLRGHYPAEVKAISDSSYFSSDGTIIVPAFFDGGRITMNDVHYVTEGNYLIPAGETPFAKDSHFGFKNSNLREWVKEKSQGSINDDQITSISLNDIRQGGYMGVVDKLDEAPIDKDSVVIVNAVHQHDLNTFVLGLLQGYSIFKYLHYFSSSSSSSYQYYYYYYQSYYRLLAEANGLQYIYRTAASFVATRAGLEPKPPLTSFQLSNLFNKNGGGQPRGGLIVVGSYVPKTTEQLVSLTQTTAVHKIELLVADIVRLHRASKDGLGIERQQGQDGIKQIIASSSQQIEQAIEQGLDTVVYTSRQFVEGISIEEVAFVSQVLSEVVRSLRVKPQFLIAKGGITSYDVAHKSLGLKEAYVEGTVDPGISYYYLLNLDMLSSSSSSSTSSSSKGIPIWRTGQESKFPGMHYIVFPGNVGDKDALARVAMKLGVKKLSDVSTTVTDKPTRTSTSKPEESKMLNALKEAQQKGYALAAFNVYNLEGAKAVVEKAEALGSPAILQIHPSSLNFGGRALIDMLISFRTYSKVPIFVHLDHSTDEKDVELALRCGVDSIMVDGSAMPLDENISWTKKMTELAHAQGVIVEAELGRLAGKEDGLEISEKESKMTNPNEAKVFVKETNVDMLAVTIGNVHGKYSRPPSLDFDRLSAIKNNVPINLPLVLHGASGLPSNLISQSIRQGVCKFNVNTDIRDAFMRNTRYLVSDVNIDMLELMEKNTIVMKKVIEEKMILFNPNLRK